MSVAYWIHRNISTQLHIFPKLQLNNVCIKTGPSVPQPSVWHAVIIIVAISVILTESIRYEDQMHQQMGKPFSTTRANNDWIKLNWMFCLLSERFLQVFFEIESLFTNWKFCRNDVQTINTVSGLLNLMQQTIECRHIGCSINNITSIHEGALFLKENRPIHLKQSWSQVFNIFSLSNFSWKTELW